MDPIFEGDTELYDAVSGLVEIHKWHWGMEIIKKGAAIRTENGDRPYAVAFNHRASDGRVQEIVIQRGASDKRFLCRALREFLHYNLLEKLEPLVSAADDNYFNHNSSPLIEIIKKGDYIFCMVPELIVELLITPHTINKKGPYGETPLFAAVDRRQWQLVDLLLKNRADKDITNDSNLSPFQAAILRIGYGPIDKPKEYMKKIAYLITHNTVKGKIEGKSILQHVVDRPACWTLLPTMLHYGADFSVVTEEDISRLREKNIFPERQQNPSPPSLKQLVAPVVRWSLGTSRLQQPKTLASELPESLVSYVTLHHDMAERLIDTVAHIPDYSEQD